MTEAVKVMVRCRPINKRQKQLNCQIVVNVDSKLNQINLYKPGSKDDPKSFTFDCVFGADSLQSYIYEQTAFSLVDNVIEGYNGTIFAYGQTGCGKTHTMMGTNQSESSRGIIPRTFSQIINFTSSQTQKKHLVQCSFIQIYNQQIHDLLGKNVKARMDLKQSPQKGVFVKDLTMNIVKSTTQMQHFMEIGFKNRAVRQTAMNKQSSRSHSIFTIHIQSQEVDQFGKEKFKVGKLNLVDLAGSQRQSKTHAVGDGMKQAAKINLSLSALGNVISALVDGKTQHIPYRDSKLTRLLQDSLGGNTKTIMIAAVSPASDNYQQTLSTLRYASRAKFIQNKPIVNEDPKDTLLREYAEQIKKLKLMLEGKLPMQPQMLQLANGGNRNNDQNHLNSMEFETKYIQVIRNDDERLQKEFNEKQQRYRKKQQEQEQQKMRLKQQLRRLEGLITTDNNQADKKQLQRMKKLKQKLKAQKKKQQQWRQQKKKRDEQLMTMQKSYKSLNQQVQQMRLKFQQIKRKYLSNLQQLSDIRQQAQRQKQQLLDTIRTQQSEINKYSGICNMLLTPHHIEQIITQSYVNEETREWVIAPFYYRDRNVNFPKLGPTKNGELIQNQKSKKEVIFKEPTKRDEFNRINATYKINDVVKGARGDNQYEFGQPSINYNMGSKQYSNNPMYQNSNPTTQMPSHKKIKQTQPVSQKIMQTLTPLKIDSETRLKIEQQMNQNANSNNYNNNQGESSNNNKVKLKPIVASGKKDHVNRSQSEFFGI